MKGMHVIFSGIFIFSGNFSSINGRQICEIEHSHVQKKNKKKKRIKLAFEIGLPVNEAQFSKPTVTKNDSFLLMLILVNINGKRHKQNRCIL